MPTLLLHRHRDPDVFISQLQEIYRCRQLAIESASLRLSPSALPLLAIPIPAWILDTRTQAPAAAAKGVLPKPCHHGYRPRSLRHVSF